MSWALWWQNKWWVHIFQEQTWTVTISSKILPVNLSFHPKLLIMEAESKVLMYYRAPEEHNNILPTSIWVVWVLLTSTVNKIHTLIPQWIVTCRVCQVVQGWKVITWRVAMIEMSLSKCTDRRVLVTVTKLSLKIRMRSTVRMKKTMQRRKINLIILF